jgi:hypothetical protein
MKLLTTPEAAKFLKRHPQTVTQWRWYKSGPKFVKQGRRILYRMDELKRYKKYLRAHA